MFFFSLFDSPLIRLFLRLTVAAHGMSARRRTEILDYLWARQTSDGGFRGRRGTVGDLYYTNFAIKTALLLRAQEEYPDRWRRIKAFLDSSALTLADCSPIDFLSGVYCELTYRSTNVQTCPVGDSADNPGSAADPGSAASSKLIRLFVERAKSWRCPDGLFARSPEGAARGLSSLYQTFLVLSVAAIMGNNIVEDLFPDPKRSFESVLKRQNEQDFGFADLSILPRSGANPTAAAWSVLQTLRRRLPDAQRGDTRAWQERARSVERFLKSLQMSDGGVRAHAAIPMADLLSTFTAWVTRGEIADELGSGTGGAQGKSNLNLGVDVGESERSAKTSPFIRSCRKTDGGFGASPWDTDSDLEYTFYSLILEEEQV